MYLFNKAFKNCKACLILTRLIAKYRPTMPVLAVVVPRLTTNQVRWSFTGAFQVCVNVPKLLIRRIYFLPSLLPFCLNWSTLSNYQHSALYKVFHQVLCILWSCRQGNVWLDDFLNALQEVKPAFGAATGSLEMCRYSKSIFYVNFQNLKDYQNTYCGSTFVPIGVFWPFFACMHILVKAIHK